MSRIITALVCVLCMSLCLPLGAAGALPEFPLEPEDLGDLVLGEVVVKSIPCPGRDLEYVTAAVLVDLKPCLVWPVMIDYENAPQFIPGLLSSKVIESRPGYDVVEQTVDIFALLPRVTYVLKSEYTVNRQVKFTRIKGDLADMQGCWTLYPHSGGKHTLLTYSIFLDPGFMVPQWLVNYVLEEDLPQLLKAIRQRALQTQKETDCRSNDLSRDTHPK